MLHRIQYSKYTKGRDYYETIVGPDTVLYRGGDGGEGADSHHTGASDLYYRTSHAGISSVLQVLENIKKLQSRRLWSLNLSKLSSFN